MRTLTVPAATSSRRGPHHAAVCRCVLAAVAAFACEQAGATAFFVNQQSVKGLGRVDAGNSAAADELGTIFFNPAGIPFIWDGTSAGAPEPAERSAASFGVNVIVPRSTQANAGSTVQLTGLPAQTYSGGDSRNPTRPTPVPNMYYAYRIDADNAVGVGVNFPFGLSARFDPGWYGRYDATEASLRTINLSLVAAHRAGPWSIGGGLDVQQARTTLEQALPNFSRKTFQLLPQDGRAYTHGDAYTAGFNIGAIYAFGEDRENRVGVHYRSGMKHNVKGTTDVSGVNGIADALYDVHADLKLPAIATAGARVRLTPSLVGLAEFAWYDWSTFDAVIIRFDNGQVPDQPRETHYRDAYGISLGAELHDGGSKWTTRGGVHYDTTPTVDAFRDVTVPDSDRLWLGLGATYWQSRTFGVDFAFTHVFFRDTNTAATRVFYNGVASATVRGSVKTTVDTIAVDLHWRF